MKKKKKTQIEQIDLSVMRFAALHTSPLSMLDIDSFPDLHKLWIYILYILFYIILYSILSYIILKENTKVK